MTCKHVHKDAPEDAKCEDCNPNIVNICSKHQMWKCEDCKYHLAVNGEKCEDCNSLRKSSFSSGAVDTNDWNLSSKGVEHWKSRKFIYYEYNVREFIRKKEELVLMLEQKHITYHEYVERSIKLAGSKLT